MSREWMWILIVAFVGSSVIVTAEKCSEGLTDAEALKMKNTIERLDKDMDKLKARKCKCQK